MQLSQQKLSVQEVPSRAFSECWQNVSLNRSKIMTKLKRMSRLTLCGLLTCALAWHPELLAAYGLEPQTHSPSYRVLDPIKSGNVTLYPIVRTRVDEKAAHWHYQTLDQGLKSGEVVVTEAGKARGLVRSRNGRHGNATESLVNSGDEVNTLVLVNHSSRPLVLLAGEIVTGGKQDRVIAKDRIVPPHSQPLDLGVFCIEPGRWVEHSAKFDAAGKGARSSFMVEPSVRRKAMAAKSQREVWDAVGSSIGSAPSASTPHNDSTYRGDVVDAHDAHDRAAATSSYAQAMSAPKAQAQVDAVAAPVFGENNEVIERFRHEQVIGVVAAIDGHIVWADLFASSELLGSYWTKLVRSYAAEAIHRDTHDGPNASKEEALQFLADATSGEETSEGETALYRYREVQDAKESLFILEALLPGTGFEVHRTKLVQTHEVSKDTGKREFHIYR
jgi:hypothetical protein